MSGSAEQPRPVRPGKADFGHIYDQTDPRAYYTVLDGYDYQLADHVQRAFGRLVAERAERDERAPRIFDLACSYGINSALLAHDDITFGKLANRYATSDLQAMTLEEVVAADIDFFAQRRKADPPQMYGCDVAGNAVRYAEQVGLLEQGWGIDLESETVPSELEDALAETDIITVSGAIGYLTHRTISKVLSRVPAERRPWFAAFALRVAPIDPVAHALRDHGLELATLTGLTVRQRRFVDEQEQEKAVAAVRERGYVTEGKEDDGYWHAAFYVGLPRNEEPLRMLELVDS